MSIQGYPSSHRFELLDILRGLSAIAVVIYHATMQYHPLRNQVAASPETASFSEWMIYACGSGYLGVSIFFMISGYCICAAAVNHRLKKYSIQRYFLRRMCRIYPPYWCCLGFFLLLFFFAPLHLPWLKLGTSLSLTQWLGNIFLFEEWRPYILPPDVTQYFLAVAWTLCYEEQFYFVVGVILLLWPRGLFPLFSVVTVFVFLNNYNLNIGPLKAIGNMNAMQVDLHGLIFDSHWLFFASGIGLYCFRMTQSAWRFAFPVFLILLLSWEFLQFDWHTNRFATRTVTFGTSLTLCVIHTLDGKICKWIVAAPLLWLGARTYSIYLIHLPLVLVLTNAEARFGRENPLFTLLCTVPLSVVVSLVAGDVFYRLVERRFIPTSLPGNNPACITLT